MSDDNLQRAKEIFFQYSCNHFHLDREVDAEEYKKFDISNEQEKKWTHEYISYWISKLSDDDFQAMYNLVSTYAREAIPEMCRISELGDSLTKLRYASAIWDIASQGFMSPIIRERARRKSISLWRSLLDNPIEFTDKHRKEVSEVIETQTRIAKDIQMERGKRGLPQRSAAFQNKTPEDYILNYAKSKLRESKKRNGFYFLFVSLFTSGLSVVSAFMDLDDKIKRRGKLNKI
jgi:hypothetical protein